MRYLVFTFAVLFAAAFSEELTEAEAKNVMRQLNENLKKVTRVEATIYNTKIGGAFAEPATSVGIGKMMMPSYMWYEDRGDPNENLAKEMWSLLILDGKYLWMLNPAEGEGDKRIVERRELKENLDQLQGIGLTSLFIGQDIDDPDQLWLQYNVKCTRVFENNKHLYHFVLAEKESENNTVIDLWLPVGEVLPWKVKTTQTVKRRGPAGRGNVSETSEEYRLENVKTNLTGLPPFPVNTFVFPFNPQNMVVNEGSTEIGDDVIELDIQQTRERMRNVIQN